MRLAMIAAFVVRLFAAALPPAHAADVPPYQAATALAHAALADARSGGILGLRPHVADIERALAGGRQAIDDAAAHGTMLTDGLGETITAMAISSKSGKNAISVANPYPVLALYLGSYYNEVGQSEDALRVMTLGLTLFVTGDLHLGDHWADLMYERGAALVALKRYGEVLAAYDEIEKLPNLDKATQARIWRSRGFILTEQGRLLEAEAAYHKSLEIEPNNDRALHELAYIEKLKAGGERQPGGLAPVQPQTTPQSESKPTH
ncbi:MAG: tetratricopeptide repeat protein [Alphaproteobacteria bacterium]|nr:tetratricopeptide repeat protein [Alphaproteobacteria bacterium]